VRSTPAGSLFWVLLAAAALTGCRRDPAPIVTGGPPEGIGSALVRTSELVAGGRSTDTNLQNPYQGQRNVLADGRRYYTWFNCAGCHGAAGGGGIGPPLADRDWIYGGEPAHIFLSIAQGRPNGMPSFAGQIPDDQIWKIVTFVGTLSKLAGKAGHREGRRGR
jgi:cytochrome c oxidase cbb3-type subunit 3